MYALGIDLGTTYTAAAIWRDGHAEIASLGSRAAVVPSVVLLRDDATFLTGEPANRRGLTEPHRLSREFKRRLGDTTPILLGGSPYSAEALSARLLRAVVEDVAEREGEKPTRVCISHPANWGPYKKDLLNQAIRLADVDATVTLTTEPEAAAVFYAQQQRIEPGAVVAVYDLGGGTFDAAVLRKTRSGFEILGQPEGIERLGGIDFDAAVFAHVRRALGDALTDLDEDDTSVVAAVARLREECVEAKEALSSDTDTTIPVLLPAVSTEVRLTREELEEMVRPALHDSIAALRRALRSAEVEPDQLHSVLLVGGSSRMPIVAQLVGAELDRPVAVDAHPKHAVALGAAWLASGAAVGAPAAEPQPVPEPEPEPEPVHTATAGTGTAAAADPPPAAAVSSAPPVAAVGSAQVPAAVGSAQVPAAVLPADSPGPAPAPPAPAGRSGAAQSGRAARWWLPVTVGAVVVALVVAGAWALAPTGEDAPPVAGNGGDLPPDEQCTEEIQANDMWVCLNSATFNDAGDLVIEYDAEWAGEIPDISTGYHLHVYGGDGTNPPAETMGNQADPATRGVWKIMDEDPAVIPADEIPDLLGDQPKVCARVAGPPVHDLVPDNQGGFNTGNCTPIAR